MNPFELAQSLGYGKNDILKFLNKAIPNIESSMTQAIQAGYTSDQVFKFLSKAMAGGKVDPKVQRRVFDSANASNIQKRYTNTPVRQGMDVKPLIGAGVGAAAGGLTGGIPGAIAGGMAGYNELDKLSKAYEKHVQDGGSVPFDEFVIKLAKGAALGGISGVGAEGLRNMAVSYLSSKQGGSEDVSQNAEVAEQSEVQDDRGNEILDQEFSTQEEVEAPKAPENIVTRAMQDVDFENLSKSKKERIKILNKNLEKMQKEGLSWDSAKVQKVIKKRDSILSGDKLTTVEKEVDRLDEGYRDQIDQIDAKEKEGERYKQLDNPTAWSFQEIFEKPPESSSEIKQDIKPMATALKSSNVSAATYDDDTNKMRVVFKAREGRQGGTVYSYDNIDLDTFKKMTDGEAKPITEGSNKFGVWFNTKKPSVGASFSKHIKNNPDKFPYNQESEDNYTLDEKQIIKSERAHLASEMFAPFAKVRLEGRQQSRATGLKDIEPSLKSMDDNFVFDIVQYLEEKLKEKLKTEPKVKRLSKEFKKEFL